MKNKDAVCFRYKKEDGAMKYFCIEEYKLWEDFDEGLVYLDLDDNSVKNLINALNEMTQ
jgi:hypothetical protein